MAQSNDGTTRAEISENCTPTLDAQTSESLSPPGATTSDVNMSQPALAGRTRARSALSSSGQSPQRKTAASVQPPAQANKACDVVWTLEADRSAETDESVSWNVVEAAGWVHELDDPFETGSHGTRSRRKPSRLAFALKSRVSTLRDWDLP